MTIRNKCPRPFKRDRKVWHRKYLMPFAKRGGWFRTLRLCPCARTAPSRPFANGSCYSESGRLRALDSYT